jgi:hypothetical protein
MSTDAERLIAAVNDALEPATAYRDDSPIPAVGTAPPVTQPGRPPMSQRATDVSALMLTAGIASIPIGGSVSLVLYTLGGVNPTVIGLCAAGCAFMLAGVAKVVTAFKSAVEAAPPREQHNHYNAPVHQEHHAMSVQSRGLIAKSINKQ